MAKIGDIVEKQSNVFEDVERVDVETLINKDLALLSIARRSGSDGDFLIFKARLMDKNKPVSFTCGSKVILEKIKLVCKHFKIELGESGDPLDFPEAILGKLVSIKSQKSRHNYYDFISD